MFKSSEKCIKSDKYHTLWSGFNTLEGRKVALDVIISPRGVT